jgi:hypothetical protein
VTIKNFRGRRVLKTALLVSIFAVALSGCSSDTAFVGEGARLPILPTEDGFAFANFGERQTDEFLNGSDLVMMFGPTVCAEEIIDPCRPIAEAAAWAMMVNNARASGHCEGFAVQSAIRFDEQVVPKTISLDRDRKITHSLIRAFATQFLPEVQKETNKWAKRSLKEKVQALVDSFQGNQNDSNSSGTLTDVGKAQFTAGLYTDAGGHALLPYGVEFISEDVAKISVLDSNWPGVERYIKIDLAANKWFFSMSGKDPENDPCEWSGGPSDFDLTPRDARVSASIPFGERQTKVAGSILVVRSATRDWSVTTAKGEYSPQENNAVEGIIARSIRGGTSKCGGPPLTEYTVTVDTDEIELKLPSQSVVFVSNASAVTSLATSGSEDQISVSNKEISAGQGIDIKVAAGEKIIAVSADNADIQINEEELVAKVTTSTGEVVTQTVDAVTQSAEIIVTDEDTTVVIVQDDVATQTTFMADGEITVESVEPPILLDLGSNQVTVATTTEIYIETKVLPTVVASFFQQANEADDSSPMMSFYEDGSPMMTFYEDGSPMMTFSEDGSPMMTFSEDGSLISGFYEDGSPMMTFSEDDSPMMTFSEDDSPMMTFYEDGSSIWGSFEDGFFGPPTTADPYGPPTTADPYGPPTTADPYGPPTTVDPYGPPTTADPYGPPTTVDPYGPPTTVDPYGPPTTADPYGPPTTADPYGPPTTVDPYGPPTTVDPYGPPTTVDPYGPPTTADPYYDGGDDYGGDDHGGYDYGGDDHGGDDYGGGGGGGSEEW